MRIQFTTSLIVALLAGCAFAQDWNVSVKTDTNGVLRVPLAAPFAASNNLATRTSLISTAEAGIAYTDASVLSLSNSLEGEISILTNNISDPRALTNGIGSGCTVTTTGKQFYVTVVIPTGSVASVDADLQDHKTNAIAHSNLLARYLTTNSLPALTNGFVDASITNGFITAANVTNDLPLSDSPYLTGTVAKASSALQTFYSTNAIETIYAGAGMVGVIIDTLPSFGSSVAYPIARFIGVGDSGTTSKTDVVANDSLFYRGIGDGGGGTVNYKIYDEGNFLAGTHYTTPSQSTQIAAAVVAPWTNQVTGPAIVAAGGLTNVTDATHGSRGGLNLHALADGSGAGFLSALQYNQVASMAGRTNAWNAGITNNQTNVTLGLASGTTVADATASNHPVSLHQLEDSLSIYRTWQLWSGSNSAIVATYNAMRTIDMGNPPNLTNVVTVSSNGQYIGYLSPSAGLTSLKAGLWQINLNAWQSASGADAVSLAAEIYIRGTNGVETELTPISGTAAQVIGGSKLEYVFSLNIPSNTVMLATDSILLKFKTSAVAGAPVTLYLDGGFMSVPTPSSQYVLASQYTAAGIAAAGGITNNNDAYTASYNLLPIVANGTATITRAMGQSIFIVPTGTVYFAADSSFPTNGDSVFNLNLWYGTSTFGFVTTSMTNTSTLTSNAMNCINFIKPYGETVFRGVKL